MRDRAGVESKKNVKNTGAGRELYEHVAATGTGVALRSNPRERDSGAVRVAARGAPGRIGSEPRVRGGLLWEE